MDVLDTGPVGLELSETPEGELWIAVLQGSVDNLRLGIRWWDEFEPGRAAQASTRQKRKALYSGRRAYARLVQSSVRFFLFKDSSFGFICEVMGYEAPKIREAMAAELLAGKKLLRRHHVVRVLRDPRSVEV